MTFELEQIVGWLTGDRPTEITPAIDAAARDTDSSVSVLLGRLRCPTYRIRGSFDDYQGYTILVPREMLPGGQFTVHEEREVEHFIWNLQVDGVEDDEVLEQASLLLVDDESAIRELVRVTGRDAGTLREGRRALKTAFEEFRAAGAKPKPFRP